MPDIFINSDEVKTPHKNKEHTHHTKKKVEEMNVLPKTDKEERAHHSHNPLSSYCYKPHGVDFLNREPEEEVILVVRRHPFTNVGWLFVVAIMIVSPLTFQYFPIISFMPGNFQFVAILIWYLLTTAIFIQGFLSWFFSVNIVTNRRVIDVDFVNLIYRKITDAEIGNIEDVTVQMGSVIRTLFDYGDVLIQTAAEIPEVEFEAVPHPDQIDKILSDLRMKNRTA